MAKKKKAEVATQNLPPRPPIQQPIVDTIEKNYMPYAMSVIISRAIPEIDGFKPAHRKLLYTMYKMGLLTGHRTKSANVVGQTMRLNPHGDASIYETMMRLTRGYEALLHPFVDSKGSFGKQYSRDMACAASRYTEVKLDAFSAELFRGIDKNAVDMVDNYDSTMQEPVLLPTSFPNILVTPNLGIAVGMSSSICPFNLAEICDGTIALLQNPNLTISELMEKILAPDFPGGASIIYNKSQMHDVFRTGQGQIPMRAKYRYNKDANCIEILEIPYSTSVELIIKRISELIKDGKLREVTDCRDEIDLSGFMLTLDLKRGTDPDLLMAKLYKLTPLQDNFSCNFNVLIGSTPRQMGILEILQEWISFRIGCLRRELAFELGKKKDKLHLLLGLGKILLDIDRAIAIIRGTQNDADVIPNLMRGFDIDEVQANFIAEIKLRNLNREYILNRIREIEDLQTEIASLEKTIASDTLIKKEIAKQLTTIKQTYAKPRRSDLIYPQQITQYDESEHVENYNCRILLTHEGYFKKITLQSLRGSDEQKLKENDFIVFSEETDNLPQLLFFTDRGQVYKAWLRDFDCVKASSLGDYIPAKLNFEDGERAVGMKSVSAYTDDGNFTFIFSNGKGVRISMRQYETKSNRRKLTSAFSSASACVGAFYTEQATDILLISDQNRAMLLSSDKIPLKATRTAGGVQLMTLKGTHTVVYALAEANKYHQNLQQIQQYKKNKIPSAGSPFTETVE